MSDALSYLLKARPEAMGHYFRFLKDAGSRLEPKTRSLISVITKVHSQTERGLLQYTKRALGDGASAEEILDGPLDDLRELADNLRDLRRSNRLLGGARQSRLAIRRLVDSDGPLRLVDVGCGGADIPVMLHVNRMVFGVAQQEMRAMTVPPSCKVTLALAAIPLIVIGIYVPAPLYDLLKAAASAMGG